MNERSTKYFFYKSLVVGFVSLIVWVTIIGAAVMLFDNMAGI